MSVTIDIFLMTLLDLPVKATLLLLAACAACVFLRRSSAAARHLVWSAALVGVLLVPLVATALPRWDLPLFRLPNPSVVASVPTDTLPQPSPPAPPAAASLAQAAPHPLTSAQRSAPSDTATATQPIVADPRLRPSFTAVIVLLIVISFFALIGTLAVLCYFAVGLRRVGRVRRAALPLEGTALEIAETAYRELGLRRPVIFLKAADTDAIAVPMTWGVLRPLVLLPPQSSIWSEGCLRAALLHELAHVQRWDWTTQLLSSLACALCWWHPLAWWAARQARMESERACDDLVLGTGMGPSDYAQRLIEVVRSMPVGKPARTVAIAMAEPSEVEGRVKAVLAKGRDRSRLSRQRLTLTMMVVAFVAVPLSALHLDAYSEAAETKPASGEQVLTRRQSRGILEFIYLKDVVSDAHRDRPFRLDLVRDAEGQESYGLIDAATGQRSRDPKTVQAAFQKLLDQGYTQRAGASPYLIPLDLSINVPTREVFFTPAQRRQADGLEREKKTFLALLDDSPIIVTDADVDKASAHMNRQIPPIPELNLTFTAEGGRKNKAFTSSHMGEIMGILVDGGFISAPTIRGEIDGEGDIAGGFRNLAEAQALADRLNKPTGQEQITPTSYHGTWPDGTQIVLDGGAADTAPVAAGYEATLANGYTVGIEGVTQAVAKDDEWSMYGGPSWSPDGTPLPEPLGKVDEGLWHWSVHQHDGVAPTVFKFTLTPQQPSEVTPGAQISTYEEFLGADGRPDLMDRLPFTRNEGAFGGATIPAYYVPGTHTCSIRCGVAAGPWQTAATLPVNLTPETVRSSQDASPSQREAVEIKLDDKPALMYQTADGHHRTEYFLGANHLGNVARRVVAVDAAGHEIPLTATGTAAWGLPIISLGFDPSFFLAQRNSGVRLDQVRQLRLETRPYQIVEFQNVQLQARRSDAPLATASSQQASPAAVSASPAIGMGGVPAGTPYQRRAQRAIRAATSAGEGRMGILNIPKTWRVDPTSFRSALHLLGVTIDGGNALSTTDQRDSVTATDPKTGQRHQFTVDAVFEGSWQDQPRGWLARSFRPLTWDRRMDGRPLAPNDVTWMSTGGTKPYNVFTKVWSRMPPSYPWWTGDVKG